jgi:signal transduction histidine kinase
VAIDDTVIAVLEFFATEAEDPDEPLLEVMTNIGTQLGTVFERERARAELREKNALLQLLQEVAVAANESQTIDSALQFAVERVCTHTGWCIGHAYLPAEATPDSLGSSFVWYLGNVKRFSPFRKRTEKRHSVPEGELSQRVLKTGEPEWVMDMTADPHFSRAKMAKRLGMKSALAFPVLSGNETVAVMEFFSSDAVEPEPSFLEAMANIGTQLGRVFERKRAERQLSTNEHLAAIGVTAAKLAHEIGNPLNGMYTTVQLLERQLADSAETHDQETDSPICEELHDLSGEIQRLQALLDDLRAFARPQQLCMQPTDLAGLVTETLAIVSDAYAECGIHVKHSLPKDLPPLEADGRRLKQVLLNLCHNAVEAMPSGGRLGIAAGHSDKQIWLEVTDTGEGIPEGLDIFELFATTKSEGTGLGLAIVQQIIQAHNGTITYTSRSGKGTTFRVCLPRSQ